MDAADASHLRFAGALLLAGGVAFNIGAFSPPWEQWSAPQLRALEVIGQRRVAWYWIHAWYVVGVPGTVLGFVVLAHALRARPYGSLLVTLVATNASSLMKLLTHVRARHAWSSASRRPRRNASR